MQFFRETWSWPGGGHHLATGPFARGGHPPLRPRPCRVAALALLVAVAPCGRSLALAAPGKEPGGHVRAQVRARARAHFETGRKRFALRQFRAALMSFKKAYELLPLSGFLFNIGQCHRFLGDWKSAIFFYSGFVRENPGTPDAKFVTKLIARCRSRLVGEQARRKEADRLFRAGRTALTLGQYGEAIQKLTAAYRKIPLPGYLFHLGQAHQGIRHYVKAVHFFRQYLRSNPGSPKAKMVLARIARCKRLHSALLSRRLGLGKGQGKGGSRPIYKRWWFWTSVAVALAATALGVGLGLGLSEPQKLPRGTLNTIDWSGLPAQGGAQ